MDKYPLHSLSRRTLLKGGLALGGAIAGAGIPLFGGLANADVHHPDAPDRYYIFCYFPGGWDILLSLDPRDPAYFTNGNIRTTQIQTGYELLEGSDGQLIRTQGMEFGPYIGDLAQHADKLTVIRGSSASTWLAAHYGGHEAIPNLSVQVENYNRDQPNFATALSVNSVDDLLRALAPGNPVLPTGVNQQVSQHLVDAALCPRGLKSRLWMKAESSRGKAETMVEGALSELFNFRANNPEMEGVRDFYGFNRNQTSSPEAQGALAVQALTQGVSRSVSISVTTGLDTHFDNWATDQGPDQARGFAVVSRMIEDLARRPYKNTGESWLDRTVILGFSDFCRTALLNSRGGRDHSLTNACFLAGGKVRGGQVIGASSDVGMQPTPVNLFTGRSDVEGEIIRPEHVLQTLFDEVGIGDAPDLRVPECREDSLNPCNQTLAIPKLLMT